MPKARHWYDDDMAHTATEVWTKLKRKATWSGLFDAEGRKLVRMPDPIGFLHSFLRDKRDGGREVPEEN